MIAPAIQAPGACTEHDRAIIDATPMSVPAAMIPVVVMDIDVVVVPIITPVIVVPIPTPISIPVVPIVIPVIVPVVIPTGTVHVDVVPVVIDVDVVANVVTDVVTNVVVIPTTNNRAIWFDVDARTGAIDTAQIGTIDGFGGNARWSFARQRTSDGTISRLTWSSSW